MRDRGTLQMLVLGALLAAGCSHLAPVRNPDPVVAAATVESTEQAILDVLPRRRWTAEAVQPGRVVAFLPIKKYLLRAEITYDAQKVQVAYLSSDNLGERQGQDGRTYVHANVNKWLQKLASDIARALARQSRAILVSAVPAPAVAVEPAQPGDAAPVAREN